MMRFRTGVFFSLTGLILFAHSDVTRAQNMPQTTSTAATLPTGIFSNNGNPLSLSSQSNSIMMSMMACSGTKLDPASTAGTLKDFFAKDIAAKKKKADAKHNGETDTTDSTAKISCDKKPTKPEDLSFAPKCTDFIDATNAEEEAVSAGVRRNRVDKYMSYEGSEYQKAINSYKSDLTRYETQCLDGKVADLLKEKKTYDCQVQAMQKGITAAGAQIQQTITNNTQQFGKMVQYQTELRDQITQVDGILGPDPELGKSGSAQSQGLLGVQAELYKQQSDMTKAQVAFQTDLKKIVQDTTTNEQTLNSNQMGVVSSCLGYSKDGSSKGDTNIGVPGGYSLNCYSVRYTTQTDSSGKSTQVPARNSNGSVAYDLTPCGPMQYLSSQLQQAAMVNSKGNWIGGGTRQSNAVTGSLAFDALTSKIFSYLGSYTPAGSDGSQLVTRVNSESDLENLLGANMDGVTAQLKKLGINFDVRSQLRAVTGHCFNEGQTWRNQQILSASSTYNKNKTDIEGRQTSLTLQLNDGLSNLNKTYGDIMAVMSGQAANLNRTSCTTDDPTKMSACFTTIRQSVTDLLEGNGSLGNTAFTIKGSTMLGGFAVPCKGINGCVTSLTQVRKAQKSQDLLATQVRNQFVQSGNSAIQQQFTSFGGMLSQAQASLNNEFKNMSSLLADMHVSVSAPKPMDGEALKQMDGPDKTQGPFQMPGNITAALSSYAPPGLTLNSDTIDIAIKSATNKVDDQIAEVRKDLRAVDAVPGKVAAVLRENAKKCGDYDIGGSTPASVASSDPNDVQSVDASNCREKAYACQDALGNADPSFAALTQIASASDALNAMEGNDSGATVAASDKVGNVGSSTTDLTTTVGNALKGLTGTPACLAQVKLVCNLDVDSKNSSGDDDGLIHVHQAKSANGNQN